jgi:hypothetical protein
MLAETGEPLDARGVPEFHAQLGGNNLRGGLCI